MRLHEISPNKKAVKKRKRVGRGTGSGRGKTSTRGQKGQHSRSGSSIPSYFEGGQMPLIRRIPKRGFNPLKRKEFLIVNLDKVEKKFNENDIVDPDTLLEKRIIKKKGLVKILASGDLTKNLTVKAHNFSKNAILKIQNAGGKCYVLSSLKDTDGKEAIPASPVDNKDKKKN